MQKKVYTGVEIEVNIFKTEDVIVASGKDHYIDDKGNNDLEIL